MPRRIRASEGFTLIELAVVMGVIAVLAVIAFATSRWTVRNASIDAAGEELVVRLAGLPATALSNGQDRIFVFVDRSADGKIPARTFVLRIPQGTDWKLSEFDPTKPGVNTAEFDENELPRRVHLTIGDATPAPAPLDAASMLDPAMLGSCGGVACFAFRYTGDGEVLGEGKDGGPAAVTGFGFVLRDVEDTGNAGAAKRRGVVLGFPTGVVKTFVP